MPLRLTAPAQTSDGPKKELRHFKRCIAARAPVTVEEHVVSEGIKDSVVAALRSTLEAEKKIGAGDPKAKATRGQGALATLVPEEHRESNQEIMDAVDSALRGSNGWGLNVFEAKRLVGALPPGAKRYLAKGHCPLVGGERMRASIQLADGSRFFEVPLTMKAGHHYRPTAHFHNDMCAGSWYMGMCFTHTTGRGTSCWDRFHRIMCDKDEGTQKAGLMVVRLEFAAANSVRRKPWGKEGNHRILLNASGDFFILFTWESEIYVLFYDDICDDLGEPQFGRGTPEHLQKIFDICKRMLLGAGAGEESRNSRWWTIEVGGRKGKPM